MVVELGKRRRVLAAFCRAALTAPGSASSTGVRRDACTSGTTFWEPVSLTVAKGSATATTFASFTALPDSNTCATHDNPEGSALVPRCLQPRLSTHPTSSPARMAIWNGCSSGRSASSRRRCTAAAPSAALRRAARTASGSASSTWVRRDECTSGTTLPEPVSLTVAESGATATTLASFATFPESNTCAAHDNRVDTGRGQRWCPGVCNDHCQRALPRLLRAWLSGTAVARGSIAGSELWPLGLQFLTSRKTTSTTDSELRQPGLQLLTSRKTTSTTIFTFRKQLV